MLQWFMPRHDAAYVPAPKKQVVACADCGCGIEVGGKRKLPSRCVDCSVAAATECIRQMQGRRGAFYDRWCFSMMAVAIRLRGEYRGDVEKLPS